MKNIIICGNYGGINTGDEAMLEGLLHFWRDKAEITVLSHNPEHTRKEHQVKSAHVLPMGPRSSITYRLTGRRKTSIELIKRADLFVLGGGSLFTDEESEKAPAMWGVQANEAIKKGIPLVMLGQTIGPLKHEHNKELVSKIFSKAKNVYVRDKNSQESLKAMGIDSILTGDLALLLRDKYKESRIEPGDEVVFIPRDWANANNPPEKIKKELKKLANGKLRVLSFNKKPESFETDANERAGCLMPAQAINIISKAKLLVSMRLHGNILASIINKPFLAVSYSPKVESFCKEISYPYFISLKSFDEDKFTGLFHSILKQKEAIADNLIKAVQVKSETLKEQLAAILTEN